MTIKTIIHDALCLAGLLACVVFICGVGLLIRAIWLLIIDLILERDEPRRDDDWLKL